MCAFVVSYTRTGRTEQLLLRRCLAPGHQHDHLVHRRRGGVGPALPRLGLLERQGAVAEESVRVRWQPAQGVRRKGGRKGGRR